MLRCVCVWLNRARYGWNIITWLFCNIDWRKKYNEKRSMWDEVLLYGRVAWAWLLFWRKEDDKKRETTTIVQCQLRIVSLSGHVRCEEWCYSGKAVDSIHQPWKRGNSEMSSSHSKDSKSRSQQRESKKRHMNACRHVLCELLWSSCSRVEQGTVCMKYYHLIILQYWLEVVCLFGVLLGSWQIGGSIWPIISS